MEIERGRFGRIMDRVWPRYNQAVRRLTNELTNEVFGQFGVTALFRMDRVWPRYNQIVTSLANEVLGQFGVTSLLNLKLTQRRLWPEGLGGNIQPGKAQAGEDNLESEFVGGGIQPGKMRTLDQRRIWPESIAKPFVSTKDMLYSWIRYILGN